MTQQLPETIEPRRSAVLIMDYQNRVVNSTVPDPDARVRRAARVLDAARSAGIPVIYIVHRSGQIAPDAPESQIHDGVAPKPGERILAKTKPGSFSTTGLDVLLREQGKDTLILVGTFTSGCVLSTLRWAADINYQLFVVGDACGDRNEEVHQFLVERIFPWQATVLTVEQFVQRVGQAQPV